ncbi:MAG TPA: tetratricopeptide repeat protein, partial [Gammaproteobacteria bacterium]|nr:tetratricopeptide repeat protein [Gammaproteobacteria bacterium]
APTLLVTVLAFLAAASPAAAQLDGVSLMREGKALFRSGLYRAALLRYREANAAGLDSALLHYNLGITHYKLEQYPEAQLWLERARQDPALTPLAAYNLGLTHRAAGQTADAQRWFEIAEANAGNGDFKTLARRAADSLHEQRQTVSAASAEAARTPVRQRREAPPGELNIFVTAAYGQDDNVNRSPAEPYVDLAFPGQPLVTPEPVSATYVPVNVLAEYVLHNEAVDSDFVFGYQMDGDYYLTGELSNDEATQRLYMGADLVLDARDNRRRTLESAFFVTRHHQRNFDPDDGLDRDINDVDISTRFYYTAAGIEAEFDHTLGAWRWGFDMHLERREHDRNAIVANYDNEIYLVKASIDYALNDATAVSFGMRSHRRVYDARLSRDLNGDLLSTNSALEYDYQGFDLGLSRRLLDSIELELEYLRLDRTDRFLGYGDYTQDVVGLHAVFRPNRRFFLSFGATSRVYDYTNAFAFNDPAAGPKELEDLSTELFAEFHITDDLSVSAELAVTDVTSTDARAQYSRAQTVFGVTWRR